MIYIIRSPIPKKGLPVTKEKTAHGITIPPVPIAGNISRTAIIAAIPTALSTPIIKNPIDNSAKVISKISKYARITLKKLPVKKFLVSKIAL